jgi:MarR family transcriptional regulator for hemolysin
MTPVTKISNKRLDPTLPPDRQKILGLAVNTLGRSILWNLAQRTAKHGVLPGTYPVIAWLMQLPDSTQVELSRMVGIEQPTMAITLRRMERDGLIERSPDPDHGRRSRVKLTPRGKMLSKVIGAAAYDVEKIAAQGLSRAEIDEFFRLAGIMTKNLSIERRERNSVKPRQPRPARDSAPNSQARLSRR